MYHNQWLAYVVVGSFAALVLFFLGVWFAKEYEPNGKPVDWQWLAAPGRYEVLHVIFEINYALVMCLSRGEVILIILPEGEAWYFEQHDIFEVYMLEGQMRYRLFRPPPAGHRMNLN